MIFYCMISVNTVNKGYALKSILNTVSKVVEWNSG